MILSEEQIRELTGRKRCDAQARVLQYLGIPYKARPDGSLVVFSAQVAPEFRPVEAPEPVLHL